MKRLLVAAWVAISLVLWAPEALANKAEETYQLAYSRYTNNLYEDAAEILRKLLAVKVDPGQDPERAAVYRKARPVFVACLFGIAAVVEQEQAAKLLAEADQVILDQYRQEPFYKLPPGYSSEVSDRWTSVYFENGDEIKKLKDARIADQKQAEARAAKLAKLRQERVDALERMAAYENFVATRSRVVAAIPFGIGQFQNDDIGWGVFFLATETLFTVSSVVSWGVAESIRTTRCPDVKFDPETNLPFQVDCGLLQTQFDISQVVNYLSLGLTGGLAVAGIIQAQVAFEPERTERRRRKLPKPVTIEPNVSLSPRGGFVGATVRF